MINRTFVSFDWAIKKILRHKENFAVLEGFLSELLGFDLKIESLLESESNKQHEFDKFDRVDILVKSTKGELMLVEVQYDDEDDYFHRMVYGISKLISEYIKEGQPYGAIKKAYSINIMYFRLGQGKDYIYEYEGRFVGKKQKDVLNPTKHQQKKYGIKTVADIFPKYYILRVGQFKEDKVEDTMDEWMYFLKKSEIKDDFKAKGMDDAQKVLRYENMNTEDKTSYQRHVENRRIEQNVIETAIEKGIRRGMIEGKIEGKIEGERQKAIQIAKEALREGSSVTFVSKITQLTLEEVEKIARGEEL